MENWERPLLAVEIMIQNLITLYATLPVYSIDCYSSKKHTQLQQEVLSHHPEQPQTQAHHCKISEIIKYFTKDLRAIYVLTFEAMYLKMFAVLIYKGIPGYEKEVLPNQTLGTVQKHFMVSVALTPAEGVDNVVFGNCSSPIHQGALPREGSPGRVPQLLCLRKEVFQDQPVILTHQLAAKHCPRH